MATKFNSLPLKSCLPKRKGSSFNTIHFQGRTVEILGVYTQQIHKNLPKGKECFFVFFSKLLLQECRLSVSSVPPILSISMFGPFFPEKTKFCSPEVFVGQWCQKTTWDADGNVQGGGEFSPKKSWPKQTKNVNKRPAIPNRMVFFVLENHINLRN